MNSNTKPKVAVIGLGSMGMGMARSIARAGFTISVFDVRADALRKLSDVATLAGSSREAAKDCDILVCTVVNSAQTKEVLFGANGAADVMKKGGVIISCATMSPESADALAIEAAGREILYLDAPISGGAVKAENGQLTIMAAGAKAAFERARPVLNAMATKVYELGDAPGVGASFKMINQLLAGVHIAAACEALVFAKRLGLNLNQVYEVITASAGNSWMFENRGPHVLSGDYAPYSAVSIFTKDLGIVSDMGRAAKFPLQLSTTALQMFLMTAAAGMENDDDASVARMLANLAEIELPTQADKAN